MTVLQGLKKTLKIYNKFLNQASSNLITSAIQVGEQMVNNPSANASLYPDQPHHSLPIANAYHRLSHSFFLRPVSLDEAGVTILSLKTHVLV